uniref:Uncharacterized protein n=1 Tax=Glossina palpalis gambiensis TaxID=67801 RepID=A0A1B0AYC6_9MUSC
MLENLLIFLICIAATNAFGEFVILNSPKSLNFKGTEPISSEDLGDVIYASLGNGLSGDAKWPCLNILDPFNLPTNVITIRLDGVTSSKLSGERTYQLEGHRVEDSLNAVADQLEADNESACVMNFENFEEAIENFNALLGNVEVKPVSSIYLKPELHIGDKQYLSSIAYINAMADNMNTLLNKCKFLSISLSVDSIAKGHGEKSVATIEALDMFATVAKNVNNAAEKCSNKGTLVLGIVKKTDNTRAKRQATTEEDKNKYNLAEYYSEDYPVIFNIILWLMVTFGFSLLAICYAIGSMDPGRDSIIYRMTSTRMKKDN